MRHFGIAAGVAAVAVVAWTQLGDWRAAEKPNAEVEAVRQELKAVRAEAEVARLKANAGVKEEKSFVRFPLEGLWMSTKQSSHTFEFFPDGTYHEKTWSTTADGTYAALDGNRLKMVAKGWLGEDVIMMTWKVEDGVLTLEGGLYPMTYRRK